MPAAAVIPAPIAYIKVVAVKKLVVGFWNQESSVRQEWCVLVFRFSLLDTRYCTLLGGSFIAARWWMQEGSGGWDVDVLRFGVVRSACSTSFL